MALLDIDDLHVHFVMTGSNGAPRTATALNGVSLAVEEGEIVGLVGETGAGKSLTALTVMGLLRPPARVVAGRVTFDGRELLGLPGSELDRLRGKDMTMVVQSPRSSLDALKRIGDQIVRVQRAHRDISRSDAHKKAIDMLATVGIPDPERRARAWPHELSGGMAQRVLIAMALINEPRLLIADEPTTGLDVTVQAQILELMMGLVRQRRMAAMIITHDLGVVAHYCMRMAVMFAGRIVEQGPVAEVFSWPAHPYTRELLAASRRHGGSRGGVTVAGRPPNLFALPSGCHYRDRCQMADTVCSTRPDRAVVGTNHFASCHRIEAGASLT